MADCSLHVCCYSIGHVYRTIIPTIGTPVQTPSVEVAVSIENERDKAELENNEKVERERSQTAENDKDNLGQLVFKLRYRSEQNALAVTVVKCKGLPARGQQNATSDPYVKLQLLPDKQHHVKTRVLRNTRDPLYDEDFTFFGISQSQLQVDYAFRFLFSRADF